MSSSPAPPAHPSTGGKSLASYQQQHRPPYKSWRKKYRKMRVRFDHALEENKRLFKEERKLDGIARRLREELDSLLDLCLELNTSPALPDDLRYNITPAEPLRVELAPSLIKPDATPEAANELAHTYTDAVRHGRLPPMDMHIVRQQIDECLSKQGATKLDWLERKIPHPIPEPPNEPNLTDADDVSYLTYEQEETYLRRLDKELGVPYSLDGSARNTNGRDRDDENTPKDDPLLPHWADLTPREWERQVELQNPQSQHNWLKKHLKTNPHAALIGEGEDNESIASHDPHSKPASKRKPAGTGGRNLAKQVAERMTAGRTDQGVNDSPGVASEDELAEDGHAVGRKKARDVDGTYRLKGGSGGNGKGKRKRSGEDFAGSGGKKARMEANGLE